MAARRTSRSVPRPEVDLELALDTERVDLVTRLVTSLEQEVAALAADLGTVAYDERFKLSAGLPAVVLSTPDDERAESRLQELLARGHGAVTCHSSDMVPASAMVSLRRLRFDDDALVATDLPDARLPWDDVSVLLRATHRRQVESVEIVTEKKFNLTRALVTGGLVMKKTRKREVATRTDESEPVLYLFRRSRQTPWILREQETHYEGLGAQLAPTTSRNFTVTVEQLRARSTLATFDDGCLRERCFPPNSTFWPI